MESFFWSGICSLERHNAINNLQKTISIYGDIVDFHFFSDLSISLTIEIKKNRLDNLHKTLGDFVQLNESPKFPSEFEHEVNLFLNITFLKGKGNLKIEVPAIPG